MYYFVSLLQYWLFCLCGLNFVYNKHTGTFPVALIFIKFCPKGKQRSWGGGVNLYVNQHCCTSSHCVFEFSPSLSIFGWIPLKVKVSLGIGKEKGEKKKSLAPSKISEIEFLISYVFPYLLVSHHLILSVPLHLYALMRQS